MGRREKPIDPGAGPVQRFAFELRKLRREAGSPTYRVMAKGAGYSIAALARAAAGETLPSLPLTRAYANACGADVSEWEQRWHRAAAEEAALPRGDDDDSAPYRGLARYEPDDEAWFFGRDQLTGDLLRLARRHRVTAVVGASGTGKSSLLRAGLIPRLRHTDDPALRPAALRIITPGGHPLRTHDEHLTPMNTAGTEADTWLIVDQFEELYTLCRDPAERTAFIDRLLAAQTPDSRLRVLIAVRADFYGRCLEHRGLTAVLRDASLPVGPMNSAELKETIVKPAAAHGLIVERELTARIIEEVDGEPGGLPLMSHALLETWRRRKGKALTLTAYSVAGGVHGAIAHTAEAAYTRLAPDQAALARRILLRLITPGEGAQDTRRPVDYGELDTDDSSDTTAVLECLARARLLTLDGDTIDLAHEALLTAWPRLREWIDEDRERLRVHRQLTEAAHAWNGLDRDPGALYRGTRLATAEETFAAPDARGDLTTLERDFLAASVSSRDQDQHAAARTARRLRRFTGALSVLLVLALTAGMVAWDQYRAGEQQRHKAVNAQQVALSRQYAAQSGEVRDQRPEVAALTALKGYEVAHTVEAEGSLLSAHAAYRANQLTGHTAEVTAVAYSPDGRTIATGGKDRTVKLWSTATHHLIGTLIGHAAEVYALAFSPDGRTLATAGDDLTVRLWDLRTRRTTATFTGLKSRVVSVAFSPDGRVLAGSGGSVVRLWDVKSRRPAAILAGHTAYLVAVAFSPDGRVLASAGGDHTIRLWDVAARRTTAVLKGHTDLVSSLAFSSDGRTLATAADDRTVRLWDVAARRTTATLATDAITLAFASDGRTLATGSAHGYVRLWDTDTQHSTASVSASIIGASSLAFSPDGRTLVTPAGGNTAAVRLWDVATHRAKATLGGGRAAVRSVAFSPDGRTLAIADDELWLWSGKSPRPVRTPAASLGPAFGVEFSPDAHLIATMSRRDGTRLWDATSGRAVATLKGHSNAVTQAAFSPDGKTLATAADDRTVRLWDVATQRAKAVLPGQTGGLSTIDYSPDGRTLVTTYNGSDYGTGSTVRLWDVATRRPVATFSGRAPTISTAAFSPDGTTFATAGAGSVVRLWDLASRRPAGTLTGHSDNIASVAFSPDGRTLASGSHDRTVRLWDMAARRTTAVLSGHKDWIRSVAFSPDGSRLATTSTDGSARLWNTDADRTATDVCTLARVNRWRQLLHGLPRDSSCG